MSAKGQMNLKPLIIILILTILLLIIIFLITPTVKDKADSMSKNVTAGAEKLRVLNEKEETYLFKMTAESSKQKTKKERELELQERAEELGININKKYLESDNKNIFFLFSSIADTLNMNIAELEIQETEIYVPLEEGEESPVKEIEEEIATEGIDNTVSVEGEDNVLNSVIPEGFKPVQAKQVSVSLYGDYIDIMLYFQMLNKLSDNFELVNLDVSPLVLSNGVPVEDYQLRPNEYGFILGNTMSIMNKLDLFYYESKLAENLKLIEEKARQETEDLEEQVEDKNDKFTALTSKYRSNQLEVTKYARYYGAPDKYNVPVPYVLSIVDIGSGFEAGLVGVNNNGTKDRGLMQINSGTAPQLMRILGIDYKEGMEHIPALNIELGTMYLSTIAQSRGINLETATESDKHYVFTAYNIGVANAEVYAVNNKDYLVTPYESVYSKRAVQKLNDFILYEDESEIEPISYTKDIIKYKEDLAKINTTEQKNEEGIEILDYKEASSIKAVFIVKETGPYTLLLENVKFNFETANAKKSPISLGSLSKEEIKEVGNNGENIGVMPSIDDANYRISEIDRTKSVVGNRMAHGLPIYNQLDYLHKLTVHTMMK